MYRRSPALTDLTADCPAAHQAPQTTGVLLINLGTPDAPEPAAIRRYLRQFLSDRRVVDLPRLLWWPILNGFILPFRPRRLAHAYGSIWEDGSPLLTHSRALAEDVGRHLRDDNGQAIPVFVAMRYGNPSIDSALASAEAQQVRRLLVLPLYPQYSATTTASAMDGVFTALGKLRWMPELRSIHQYHDFAPYISALAHSVRAHWDAHGRGDHLLMSFHGIPQRYFLAGDPYHCHCHKTARLLAEALDLPNDGYSITFQSRFGREPWLQPYTDARIDALAAQGVKTLDVICPGFAADCLETLEEVAQQYRDQFSESTKGAGQLRYIPALNADAMHADALCKLLSMHLRGWRGSTVDAEQIAQRVRQLAATTP